MSTQAPLPLFISAEATVKAKNSDKSIFDPSVTITADNFKDFNADTKDIKNTVRLLKEAGFAVSFAGKSSVYFEGSAQLFKEIFKVEIVSNSPINHEGKIFVESADGSKSTFLLADKSTFSSDGDSLKELITGIIIDQPTSFFGNVSPPANHLAEKDAKKQLFIWELAEKLGDKVIRESLPTKVGDPWPYQEEGEGIDVFMMDSGFGVEHPFFEAHYGVDQIKNLKNNRKASAPLIKKIIDFSQKLEVIVKELRELRKDVIEDTLKGKPLIRATNIITFLLPNANIDKGKLDQFFDKSLDPSEKIPNLTLSIEKETFESAKRKKAIDHLIGYIQDLIQLTKSINEDIIVKDTIPHGTTVASSLLGIAPKANLKSISFYAKFEDKAGNIIDFSSNKGQVFEKIGDDYDGEKIAIINASWGEIIEFDMLSGPEDDKPIIAWKARIHRAIRKNIIPVFAAGNFGKARSAIPFVNIEGLIIVGGAYFDDSGNLTASNFAHGYKLEGSQSAITLCGLCGPQAKADRGKAFDADQFEDIKTPDKLAQIFTPVPILKAGTKEFKQEWATVKGTSQAAPHVAGACARILNVLRKNATPKTVIRILTLTAKPITQGRSAQDTKPPEATGAGLLQIHSALQLAKICQKTVALKKAKINVVLDKIREFAASDSFTAPSGSEAKDFLVLYIDGAEKRMDFSTTLDSVQAKFPIPVS